MQPARWNRTGCVMKQARSSHRDTAAHRRFIRCSPASTTHAQNNHRDKNNHGVSRAGSGDSRRQADQIAEQLFPHGGPKFNLVLIEVVEPARRDWEHPDLAKIPGFLPPQ